MIECVARGIDKGWGIEYLADYYGIPLSQVIAMGDSFNDAAMIKAAGLGVAMGNSPEPIKKLADVVADDNNADGVAKIIEKYCL